VVVGGHGRNLDQIPFTWTRILHAGSNWNVEGCAAAPNGSLLAQKIQDFRRIAELQKAAKAFAVVV
jgi:hypothetical protein